MQINEDVIKAEEAIFINCKFRDIEQAIVLSVIASGYWPRDWLTFSGYKYPNASTTHIERILRGIGRSRYSIHVCSRQIERDTTHPLSHPIFFDDFNRLSIEFGMALGGCQNQWTRDKHQFIAIVPDVYAYHEFLEGFNDNQCLPYPSNLLLDEEYIFKKIIPWMNNLPNCKIKPSPHQIGELWQKFCMIKEGAEENYFGQRTGANLYDEHELPKQKLIGIICGICENQDWWQKQKPGWYEMFKNAAERREVKDNSDEFKESQHVVQDKEFDVFISYNSHDRDEVISITQQLKYQGIKCWLDIEQIPPGHFLLDTIGQAISVCRTGAIFIGQDGLGQWQKPEIRSKIREYFEKNNPVIPVLLPGVEMDNIPPEFSFLKDMHIVKCQHITDKKTVRLLIWGITGKKPENLEI